MTGPGTTTVCLFGAYPVRVDGQPLHLGISGATEKLFNYLLVNAGKETRREFLADLFWRGSPEERQRSALNSAIWRIKRQLSDIDGIDLDCNGPAVCLQVAPFVKVDAAELTRIVHSISLDDPMSDTQAAGLRGALDACAAPFMDGVTSDWVLTERERLFNIQIRGMIILMHWLGQRRRYEDALEIGRRLLAADPAREAAQCEVMWLYVLNGQRAQALRQYQQFRAWLQRELGIEPMAETQALHEYIKRGLGLPDPADTPDCRDASALEAGKSSFDRLLGAIERSRREFFKALGSPSL